MTAAIWRNASEARLRAFVVAQDKRFQDRMRKVYGIPVPRQSNRAQPLSDGWKRIAEEVCAKHGVEWAAVNHKTRVRRVCNARDEVFYRLHMETGMSYPAIGAKVGGRDHATVLVGARRHKQRLAGAAL